MRTESDEFDQKVSQWLITVTGNGGHGIVVAQTQIPEKRNEIPEFKNLLELLNTSTGAIRDANPSPWVSIDADVKILDLHQNSRQTNLGSELCARKVNRELALHLTLMPEVRLAR